MIARILQYLLSFFKTTSKKESGLNKRIQDGGKRLKEIENEKNSNDDIINHFND